MNSKLYVYRDNKGLVVTTGDKVVADTASDDFSRSEQIAHAAFIVGAVNSHPLLVAVLERIADKAWAAVKGDAFDKDVAVASIEQLARTALAAVAAGA